MNGAFPTTVAFSVHGQTIKILPKTNMQETNRSIFELVDRVKPVAENFNLLQNVSLVCSGFVKQKIDLK